MTTKFVLFQASFSSQRRSRADDCTPEQEAFARSLAADLGRELIEAGFGIILNGGTGLDANIGESAVATCQAHGIDPRTRIHTYPYGDSSFAGFGMIIAPADKRWQEVRTFTVGECDAVVAISGGKGTSDSIQKAVLAGKPVFPVATVPGASKMEWARLHAKGYANRTANDFAFLADMSLEPAAMAQWISKECERLLRPQVQSYSNRIFIVHGHDSALKLELARFVEKLSLTPVILHEQVDAGRTIFNKLQEELADVGFGFVLLTPDDVAAPACSLDDSQRRARQNVVFEHGLLIGLLGPGRVCAIVKGDVEIPSDIHGVIYKHVPESGSLASVSVELAKELTTAGYDIDMNRLIE